MGPGQTTELVDGAVGTVQTIAILTTQMLLYIYANMNTCPGFAYVRPLSCQHTLVVTELKMADRTIAGHEVNIIALGTIRYTPRHLTITCLDGKMTTT